MEKKTFRVTGMGCEACVTRVKKAVSVLEGVKSAEVDLAAATLTVEYDETKLGFSHFKDAVDRAGYDLAEM